MQENVVLLPPPALQEYVAADDTPLRVHGIVNLQVMIANRPYDIGFLVADVTSNLLGYDTLFENDLVLFHRPLRLYPAHLCPTPSNLLHSRAASSEDTFLFVSLRRTLSSQPLVLRVSEIC